MSAGRIVFWGFVGAAAMFLVPQVFILLALGMSPTIVAFIVDKSKQKYATFCVGGLNFAGVTPSIIELWMGKNDISQTFDILTNPFDVIIMFTGAAFGWIIYLTIPTFISGLMAVISQQRIASLRSEQKRLSLIHI